MPVIESTPADLWAVVPVKNIDHVKTRLAGVLCSSERQQLFRAMLEDVLQALSCCPQLAGVLVVTRDQKAKSIARSYGAHVLVEEKNLGHTAASMLGARTLAQEKRAGMLQVPADIPLLTPADICALIEAHGPAPAITLAPSRDKKGSNAVVCTPADVLPLRFGDYSFPPHVAASRALGIEPTIIDRPGLALDIDTPTDLAVLLEQPSATRTYEYLMASDIRQRLLNKSLA